MSERFSEEFLSDDERKLVQRILSHPEDFPPGFGSWIVDHSAVNGSKIPVTQLQGFRQFLPNLAFTGAAESTTSTSFGNLTTTGPELTGIADGQYLLLFGCHAFTSVANGLNAAMMAPAVNGETLTDSAEAEAAVSYTDVPVSIVHAAYKNISNAHNNTITMKFKQDTAGTATFSHRWLVAIRIGN